MADSRKNYHVIAIICADHTEYAIWINKNTNDPSSGQIFLHSLNISKDSLARYLSFDAWAGHVM